MPSVCGHIVNNLCSDSRITCVASSTTGHFRGAVVAVNANNSPIIHSLSTARVTHSSTRIDYKFASVAMRVIPTFHSAYNHHHMF